MWQISYPPANWASQGNYFLPKSHNLAVFEEKNRLTKTAPAAKVANFLYHVKCWNSGTCTPQGAGPAAGDLVPKRRRERDKKNLLPLYLLRSQWDSIIV